MDSNYLENFFRGQSAHIRIGEFALNLIVAGILSGLMAYMYARRGKIQSSRALFAGNFFLISMTTMLVISVVKSSLALSLGLIGTLSVIRFRTAIKDPEELSFLFLSVAIGLGLGADQRLVTIVGLVFILTVYAILKKMHISGEPSSKKHYLYLSNLQNMTIGELQNILDTFSEGASLKRFGAGEAVFIIQTTNLVNLDSLIDDLKKRTPNSEIRITEYQDL